MYLTTDLSGTRAASDENSLTADAIGRLLLQDHDVLQKPAQFNRERMPEPVVHANGRGACSPCSA